MANANRESFVEDEGFTKILVRRHNLILLCGGLATLVLVAIVSEAAGGAGISDILRESSKTVATEFGFALLIAAVLSASFEENTRRRFHKEVDRRIGEVQQNVFRCTYGRHLPEEFANEVEELLFRPRFVHSKYHVRYDFSYRTGDDVRASNVIDLKVTHRFSVRNLTAFSAPHSIQIFVQGSPNVQAPNSVRIESAYVYGYQTLDQQQIDEINKNSAQSGGFREFRIVTTPLPPGDDVEVVVEIRTTAPPSGFATTRCSRPTKGLTVVAKFPVNLQPTQVGADAVHREECRRIGTMRETDEYAWAIEGALLPYQGICFWWNQINRPPIANAIPRVEPETSVDTWR